jgi:hypothetical protein
MLGLEPWGRIRVDYQGLSPSLPFIIQEARLQGIPPEELHDAIGLLMDHIRRQRILYDDKHKTFTKFWGDGDKEILNGFLPEMDPPKGTKLRRASDEKDSYVYQWLGKRESLVQQAFGKWGIQDQKIDDFLERLFGFLSDRANRWLVPVTLAGRKGKPLPGQSGLYQVNADKIKLSAGSGVWKCRKCGRRSTRKSPRDLCMGYR